MHNLRSVPSTLYAIIDLETTGLNPATESLVEIGACLYQDGVIRGKFETLVDPERHIPPSASGVHHIRDRDVMGAPKRYEALEMLRAFVKPANVYVAHNATFDSSFIPELNEHSWLCTMRLSKHIWPNLSDYKNQTLRYALDVDESELRATTDHRALADALVTAAVLNRTLEECRRLYSQRSLQWLIDYAESPVEVAIMPRGNEKTKGKAWQELTDRDLMYWFSRDDIDRDLRFSLEQELYIRHAAMWPAA